MVCIEDNAWSGYQIRMDTLKSDIKMIGPRLSQTKQDFTVKPPMEGCLISWEWEHASQKTPPINEMSSCRLKKAVVWLVWTAHVCTVLL